MNEITTLNLQLVKFITAGKTDEVNKLRLRISDLKLRTAVLSGEYGTKFKRLYITQQFLNEYDGTVRTLATALGVSENLVYVALKDTLVRVGRKEGLALKYKDATTAWDNRAIWNEAIKDFCKGDALDKNNKDAIYYEGRVKLKDVA